jgi:metal-responsive CopG/Arc/MetJ family transcriptional regulator
MSLKFLRTSIAFGEARALQIDQLCETQGITRTAMIRDAVNAYLDRQGQGTLNTERMAMTSEFTQAAVDILIREQAPERRDEIIATVEQRMELYHAKG